GAFREARRVETWRAEKCLENAEGRCAGWKATHRLSPIRSCGLDDLADARCRIAPHLGHVRENAYVYPFKAGCGGFGAVCRFARSCGLIESLIQGLCRFGEPASYGTVGLSIFADSPQNHPQNHVSRKRAWSWVPSLYFAEGIPYIVVMQVAVIMYKRFGITNTEIALYTSWL